MKKQILIFIDNHFDITWRRCFDREFTWKGDTFVSYAEIEDYYITDNLKCVEEYPGYKFQIESVAVVRKYLERHPDKKDTIKKLLADGTIYIPFAGDNIVDSNMSLGETTVRNYMSGKLWLENNLDFSPDICTRNDAFGNCGQIPQIVNGCEGDWVTSISYCPLKGDIWEGIDGSQLKYLRLHSIGHGGGFIKYPPCHVCHGDIEKRKTCPECEGRGIDYESVKKNRFKFRLDRPEMLEKDGWGVFPYGGEEILPNEDIFDWIEEHKDEYEISFATMPIIREKAGFPENSEVFKGDLNPSSTGCFVSRIKTKQLLRESEYKMLIAESLGVMALIADGKNYSKEKADKIWEDILFGAFHDAVTGTHVDPCYDELLDVFAGISVATDELKSTALACITTPSRNMVSIINPTANNATETISVPCIGDKGFSLKSENCEIIKATAVENGMAIFAICDMKPYEIRRFEIVETQIPKIIKKNFYGETFDTTTMLVLRGDAELDEAFADAKYKEIIENSRYRITADDFGITEIYDKKLDKVLSATAKYRPGEWILEHDEGSPWATLSDDRRRFRLAPYTRLVSSEQGEGFARLKFKTVPPMTFGYGISGIDITTYVTIYEGVDRIEFSDDTKWDTMNHRLRFAMPVSVKGETLYEVPYGFMERKPYYKSSTDKSYLIGWNAATGDWAAINWAGVSGKDCSVALMNKGLPSYIIEDDTIFLSVLRSPGVPICLHEGKAYTMLDFDGMRDSGWHHHEFAFASYDCPLPESTIVNDADSYQAGLIFADGAVKDCDMPYVISDNVRISSVKQTENLDGITIRLAETAGKSGKATIHIPIGFTEVYETNMLERNGKNLDVTDSQVEVSFEPFKIKTLVCKK